MRIRSPYPFGGALAVTAVAAVMVLTLLGCQATEGNPAGAPSGTIDPSTASTSPSLATKQPTTTKAGATSTTGPLPDVCAILSRSEVSTLTGGKPILAVSSDPGPQSPVRYCQWQMSGAQVVIQLSSTTEARFRQDHPSEPLVRGLGDDAFFYSNHLFVRKGTTQIDVYASTAEGPTNDQKVAKAAATMVVPRL